MNYHKTIVEAAVEAAFKTMTQREMQNGAAQHEAMLQHEKGLQEWAQALDADAEIIQEFLDGCES